MPPRTDVPNDPGIEVKIESLLADTRQLFLETQFVWEMAPAAGAEFDPRPLLEAVDAYNDGPVTEFVTSSMPI